MRQKPESPTHRTVDTREVRLAVTERGDTRQPAVLLVHGYPDTSSVWDEVAADLADRFHVITYDVRGAGASSAPPDPRGYRLSRLVADLSAVIDKVSPDRPVHVVGHDWGAIQAWEAVAQTRLAGRIASLTSVGGPSLGQVSAWLRRRAVSGPRGLADVAGELGRWWYVAFFQLPMLPELAWRGGLGHYGPASFRPATGCSHALATRPAPITRDAVRGLALYRVNIGGRPGRGPAAGGRPRPTSSPPVTRSSRGGRILPSPVTRQGCGAARSGRGTGYREHIRGGSRAGSQSSRITSRGSRPPGRCAVRM